MATQKQLKAIEQVKKSIKLMKGRLSDESMLIAANNNNMVNPFDFIKTICLPAIKKEYNLELACNHPAVGRIWICKYK